MDYNSCFPNNLQLLTFSTFRDCSTEELVDFVKYLESKLEIDNTLSDTVTTFSHDKIISLFENKYTDILNCDEWETKSLENNQGSDFNTQGGQKLKSVMCYNYGELGHIDPELRKPCDYDAINYRKALMQKSFPHY